MGQFDDMIPEFVAESRDLLPEVEQGLLALEEDPTSVDPETVNTIFRAMHSIKGGASFVGLARIEKLAHKMEDLLNLLRNGDLSPTRDVSSTLLGSLDVLAGLLDNVEASNDEDIDQELQALQAIISGQAPAHVQAAMATPVTSQKEYLREFQADAYTIEKYFARGFVFLIGFDLVVAERKGVSPFKLIQDLLALGEMLDAQIQVAAGPDDPLEVAALNLNVLFFSVLEEDLLRAGLDPEPATLIKLSRDDFQVSPAKPASPPPPRPAMARPAPPAPPQETGEPDVVSQETPAGAPGATESIWDLAQAEEPADKAERPKTAAQPGEYLSFFLADEEYGVETGRVQEIISHQHVARLPRVPKFVKGVINLRGMVVPVVDLREKLGFAGKAYDKYTVVVVIQVNGKTIGLIVDSVSDVNELAGAQIQPAPEFARGLASEYVKGLGRVGERFLILLDLDGLLKKEELVRG